jgi:hypothetical protein
MRLGDLEEGTERWEDAYSVARETVWRARRNVERIVDFLRQQDYRFEPDLFADDDAPWRPPTPATPGQVQQLVALVGPLPLSLRAWWEIVGGLSLQGAFADTWDHPEGLPMTDPLMIRSVDETLDEIADAQKHGHWQEWHDQGLLDLAPDIYHKAKTSGGGPYQMRFPDRRADAPLFNVLPPIGTLPEETFVEYLRRSFRWAGFPGLAFSRYPEFDRLIPLIDEMLPL